MYERAVGSLHLKAPPTPNSPLQQFCRAGADFLNLEKNSLSDYYTRLYWMRAKEELSQCLLIRFICEEWRSGEVRTHFAVLSLIQRRIH